MAAGIWLVLLGAVALGVLLPATTKPLGGGAIAAIAFAFLFGPISALWSVWGLISAALNAGWIEKWPVYWVSWVLSSVAQGLCGSVLTLRAIQLISGMQLPLVRGALLASGLLCIASGGWLIAAALIFTTP